MRAYTAFIAITLFASTEARAQSGSLSDSILRLRCDQTHDALTLHSAYAAEDAWDRTPSEDIDVSRLVLRGTDDANPVRTGTRVLMRRCGRYSLKITAGYLNGNVMGELGAMEEFPVVELAWDGKTRIGPLKMGVCEEDSLRFGDCAREWVASIDLRRGQARVTRHSEGSFDPGSRLP